MSEGSRVSCTKGFLAHVVKLLQDGYAEDERREGKWVHETCDFHSPTFLLRSSSSLLSSLFLSALSSAVTYPMHR